MNNIKNILKSTLGAGIILGSSLVGINLTDSKAPFVTPACVYAESAEDLLKESNGAELVQEETDPYAAAYEKDTWSAPAIGDNYTYQQLDEDSCNMYGLAYNGETWNAPNLDDYYKQLYYMRDQKTDCGIGDGNVIPGSAAGESEIVDGKVVSNSSGFTYVMKEGSLIEGLTLDQVGGEAADKMARSYDYFPESFGLEHNTIPEEATFDHADVFYDTNGNSYVTEMIYVKDNGDGTKSYYAVALGGVTRVDETTLAQLKAAAEEAAKKDEAKDSEVAATQEEIDKQKAVVEEAQKAEAAAKEETIKADADYEAAKKAYEEASETEKAAAKEKMDAAEKVKDEAHYKYIDAIHKTNEEKEKLQKLEDENKPQEHNNIAARNRNIAIGVAVASSWFIKSPSYFIDIKPLNHYIGQEWIDKVANEDIQVNVDYTAGGEIKAVLIIKGCSDDDVNKAIRAKFENCYMRPAKNMYNAKFAGTHRVKCKVKDIDKVKTADKAKHQDIIDHINLKVQKNLKGAQVTYQIPLG